MHDTIKSSVYLIRYVAVGLVAFGVLAVLGVEPGGFWTAKLAGIAAVLGAAVIFWGLRNILISIQDITDERAMYLQHALKGNTQLFSCPPSTGFRLSPIT